MKQRITIVIDPDLLKKLRELQVKRIETERKSVSVSSLVNEIIRKEFVK